VVGWFEIKIKTENGIINVLPAWKWLLEKCKNLDYNFLAKDVEPFLIDPNQKERVLDFYSFIKKQLENN
jgi:hypothetical protein